MPALKGSVMILRTLGFPTAAAAATPLSPRSSATFGRPSST